MILDACLACFEAVPGGRSYHPRCSRQLFGTTGPPDLDLDLARILEGARAMVGGTSLSGVQQKLSMALSSDGKRLVVAHIGGTHILKPQIGGHAHVPENEALTMQLARLAGIETPPSGLMRLRDGTAAYVIRRFDREGGRKLALEDLCQLGELPPGAKYDGSYEQGAKLIRRFATAPIVELGRYFRLVMFSWWVGNEDLHRKNLSLLTRAGGEVVLAPAYDLLCSRAYYPDRELGLKLAGKDRRIRLADWEALATACGLPPAAARRAREAVAQVGDRAIALIDRGVVPEAVAARFREIIVTNTAALTGGPAA